MLLLGYNVSETRPLVHALTEIYGIGLTTSTKICAALGITVYINLKEVIELKKLRHLLALLDEYKDITGYKLAQSVRQNIAHLIEIKCRRGYRHLHGHTVRGQRMRSNAVTQRKLGPSRC